MSKKKIFYGWFIVAGCVLIMALGYAPLVSCASLFIKPITEDLGIGRSAYTLVNTISTLLGVFLAPLAGKLMSSKHMHKILVVCIAGVSVSYGIFSKFIPYHPAINVNGIKIVVTIVKIFIISFCRRSICD